MDDLYADLDQMFEWDRMKAARNAIVHQVRFPEAASVLFDEFAIFEIGPGSLRRRESLSCAWYFGSGEDTLGGACAAWRTSSPD